MTWRPGVSAPPPTSGQRRRPRLARWVAMMGYAKTTKVTPSRSREEIERTLRRYGAGMFAYGWQDGRAMVGFEMNGRRIRFFVNMPKNEDFEYTESGRKRSRSAVEGLVIQGERQRWRALLLVIKAKLEAIETGIGKFDEEFLAHIVLPDGTTVGSRVLPAVENAYISGRMPKGLLPDFTTE